MNKKIILGCVTILLGTVTLFGCTKKDSAKDSDKLKIVSTVFAPYDFAKQVVKDKGEVKMLLPPGTESHSFEPTPQDIAMIESCDVFVYVGGESDEWITDMIDSVKKEGVKVVRLMDCVELVEEELVDGMEAEEEEHAEDEKEYDEHVWTSPRNGMLIVDEICDAVASADKENASYYEDNASEYKKDLSKLDEEIKDVVTNAKRKTVVFGDRFPLRYFVEAYGLEYYAAFPGCSDETEPSAATIAFLTDKVKKENIPVVFYLEMSNRKMADTICEGSFAKKLMFHACHNVTKKDMDNGVTYLELMEKNKENLKIALN